MAVADIGPAILRIAVVKVAVALGGRCHPWPSHQRNSAAPPGALSYLAGTAWALPKIRRALREKPKDPPANAILLMTSLLAVGATYGLVFLATQGNAVAPGARPAHVNSTGTLPQCESLALAVCLIYTLLWSPEITRRKLPFEHASEQALRLVPASFAVGAAIATGSYLVALHFFNQPLAKIPPGPLAASIVAVMALLTPFYQLIARACWRYGLADLLDPAAWRAKWSEVTYEITSFRIDQATPIMKDKQSTDTKDAIVSTTNPNQADT